MPGIHVCSLARLEETVCACGAASLISLLRADWRVRRPAAIAADRHLHLAVSDITVAAEGQTLPAREHVDTLIDFVRRWDRREALLIHCLAGISRSTAAAFIAACALRPGVPELTIARTIRDRSPTAMPNTRLVELGDEALQRGGAMIAAVAALGPARECIEGAAFHLDMR